MSRQNDVLGRCKGCGAPPEEPCMCDVQVRKVPEGRDYSQAEHDEMLRDAREWKVPHG